MRFAMEVAPHGWRSVRGAMDDEAERVSRLTDLEREALEAFLRCSDIQLVARIIGKSIPTAEQRLARARRKLGVHRSIDAAHMYARVQGRLTYGSAIYTPSVVADVDPPDLHVVPAENGSRISLLPFPTQGRPWNDHPGWVRLGTIGGGMLLAAISIVLIADLLETVTRIVRQMH